MILCRQHCNALQETTPTTMTNGTMPSTLQRTATHCNTLQHTATHCDILQETMPTTQQHTATHGNTRQHTATHCNTLQHNQSKDYVDNNGEIEPMIVALVCCSVLHCVAFCFSLSQQCKGLAFRARNKFCMLLFLVVSTGKL